MKTIGLGLLFLFAADVAVIRRRDWFARISAGTPFPPRCRKMMFLLIWKPLWSEKAFYSVEFDERWNVSKVGPLELRPPM